MADTYQRVSCQKYVDHFSSERTQALASLADRTKIQAERLLVELFPLLRSYSYDKLSQKDFSLSRRVAASDRLRIALTYDLPSDEVSLEEIESFCYTPAVRDAVIDQILTRDLLDHFLEAVLQKIEPARVMDSHEFVFYLGKLVEKKQVNSSFQGFRSLFRMSMIDKIILLAENVLKLSVEHADDLTRLDIYVSDTSILTLGTHLLVRRLATREERKQQSEPEADKNLLQASDEPVLQHWLDTSMRTLCDQSFLQIADKWIVVRVLLSLKEGRDKLPELLQPYLDSDDKFDAIADVFVSSQTESAEGMSVNCSEELLSMLGDPETIRRKAKNRLRDPSVQSSMRLCAIYRSIVHEKKMYIGVSAETQEWDE